LATLIRRIEELSLNAWPCLRQIVHDGWLLRFADGYTGRSNSVQSLYEGEADVRAKIEFCEQAYVRLGIPCLFKMTEAARPAGLDALLDSLGYHAFNQTSVQVLDLAGGDAGDSNNDVRVYDGPHDAWLRPLVDFRSIEQRHVPTLRAILHAIALPARYLTVVEGDEVLACGLAVLERPWAGIFDIVTREDRRGRGHGTRVMRALLAWARSNGATRAYLQVMKQNEPALRLYERLGFREAYAYWYRVKRK
jgi:ribosomal protein S18 acetylase RimI-like enzyme